MSVLLYCAQTAGAANRNIAKVNLPRIMVSPSKLRTTPTLGWMQFLHKWFKICRLDVVKLAPPLWTKRRVAISDWKLTDVLQLFRAAEAGVDLVLMRTTNSASRYSELNNASPL